MALPDDTIKRIHKAMQDSGGSIAAAAVLMSWPRQKLATAIATHGELQTKWLPVPHNTKDPEMSDVKAAMRPNDGDGAALGVLVPANENVDISEQEEVVRAMADENERFSQTLQSIGWSKNVSEVAKNLQGMAQHHFKSGLELMHGGLQHTFLSNIKETSQLQPLFDQVATALADMDKYPIGSKPRSAVIQELERLHQIMSDIKQSTVKVNEVIHKSALVQAMLKKASKKKRVGRKAGAL